MIVDERMTAFINSLDTGNTPFLTELEVKALEDHVPIIRREMQSFLKVLLQMQRPVNILEVGTAVGFPHCCSVNMHQKRPKSQQLKSMKNAFRSQKKISEKPGRSHRSVFWKGMPQRFLQNLRVLMILSLWTLQKGSIFIFCRM